MLEGTVLLPTCCASGRNSLAVSPFRASPNQHNQLVEVGGRFILEYTFLVKDATRLFDSMQELSRCRADGDDGEALLADIDQTALDAELRDMISRHVPIPTSIGSGRGSVAHKAHALLHSLYMDLGSWASVRDFMASVVSFTSDQGVEALLATLPAGIMDKDFVPRLGEWTKVAETFAASVDDDVVGEDRARLTFANELIEHKCLRLGGEFPQQYVSTFADWANSIEELFSITLFLFELKATVVFPGC